MSTSRITTSQQTVVSEVRAQSNELVTKARSLVRAVRKHGLGSEGVKIKSQQMAALMQVLLGTTEQLNRTGGPRLTKAAMPMVLHRAEFVRDRIWDLAEADKSARLKAAAGDAEWPKMGWVGDVDNGARKLRELADASGKPQAMDFNGRLLLARPGQDPKAAVASWRNFSTDSPLSKLLSAASNLHYQIEQQAGAAETQIKIQEAAARPPRSEATLLADLSKKNPKNPYLEGMSTLLHPREIETLAHAYAAAAPQVMERSDKIKTDEDAIRTALKNMRFWVNEREGAVSGTEGMWNVAIDLAEKESIGVRMDPMAGDNLSFYTVALAEQAKTSGFTHYGEFNGVKLVAKPGDSAEQVASPYRQKMAEWQKQADDKAAKAAAERAEKLKDATLITAAPQDLKVDTRGKLGDLYLITPSQLATLPQMTRLYCIDGKEAVVGIDNIDDDTRGGFIAYGFKAKDLGGEFATTYAKEQAELEAKIGGPIIDGPPAGMALDPELRIGAINLITTEQLEMLPKGTRLYGFFNESKIVGVDEIGNNGGRVSYGFHVA